MIDVPNYDTTCSFAAMDGRAGSGIFDQDAVVETFKTGSTS
jgi:hypothetical protein